MIADRLKKYWRQIAALVIALAVLIALVWYVVENPVSQLFGPTVTQVPLHQKYVALTFDDGPNPPYTNEIVDYLHAARVPATFFVVGMAVARHPEVLRLEVADGNAIGNHSWSHAHMVLETRAHMRRQIAQTADEIQAVSGVRTSLFRPPYGARDFAVIGVARSLGYQVIMWSVPLPRDWQNPPPQVIAARVLGHVGDGSIIVLHDGNRGLPGDRSSTVAATKLIVTALRREGFRFVTVPQLLQLGYRQGAAPPGPAEYDTTARPGTDHR